LEIRIRALEIRIRALEIRIRALEIRNSKAKIPVYNPRGGSGILWIRRSKYRLVKELPTAGLRLF
jgi:hypothetical protein